MSTIGSRLRRKRLSVGLSQRGVAEELGATRQMVSAWEHNVARPNTDHLAQVCQLYRCGVDEILYGSAAPPGPKDPLLERIFARPGAGDPYLDLARGAS